MEDGSNSGSLNLLVHNRALADLKEEAGMPDSVILITENVVPCVRYVHIYILAEFSEFFGSGFCF